VKPDKAAGSVGDSAPAHRYPSADVAADGAATASELPDAHRGDTMHQSRSKLVSRRRPDGQKGGRLWYEAGKRLDDSAMEALGEGRPDLGFGALFQQACRRDRTRQEW